MKSFALLSTVSAVQYILEDGSLKSENVSTDILQLSLNFGMDGVSTWTKNPDAEKATLWDFMGLVNKNVGVCRRDLGIVNTEFDTLTA